MNAPPERTLVKLPPDAPVALPATGPTPVKRPVLLARQGRSGLPTIHLAAWSVVLARILRLLLQRRARLARKASTPKTKRALAAWPARLEHSPTQTRPAVTVATLDPIPTWALPVSTACPDFSPMAPRLARVAPLERNRKQQSRRAALLAWRELLAVRGQPHAHFATAGLMLRTLR